MHASSNCRRMAVILFILAVPAFGQAQQADEGEQEQAGSVETAIAEESDALELETQVVTGSRLIQPYDPIRWDARGQVLFLELHWEM